LFVSLVGCVIPRTKHHIDALRSQPPRTPAKLERLSGFRHSVADKAADAEAGVEAAAGLLRRSGYRVRRFGSAADGWSVSAERGYLRETGNLVFHFALVGILIAVGFGGGFVYSGQRVVVEGQSFSNNLANYDSFNPGRFFQDSMLVPYSITLDRFTATYEENNVKAYGQAIDYTAAVTTELPGATAEKQIIKVNSPLGVGGTDIYLLGNGYAPDITVRDGDGNIAYSQPTAFLPQDANLTSVGVIKVPDALPKQLGLIGFFYPTVCDPSICSAALTSVHPALRDPTLTLEVYTGDLGLNDGVARNAFSLNTDKLTQVAGRKSVAKTLKLKIGDTIQLPDGLGSVTFNGVKRFVSLDIHHDPTQLWVLGFAILVLAGLLTGLFIPRRRVWVKAVKTRGGVRFEYAGLARGEDPGLEAAVAEIARKHSQQLGLRLGE
jgi:cytochrome c biogenesis protein